MAICPMCNGEMNQAKGCIDHKVLLNDGSVIDSPHHTSRTGGVIEDRCHDCGAKPQGIHHPGCDWARAGGARQLLSAAVRYWKPGADTDPREKESDLVFIVKKSQDESDTVQLYSSLSVANKVANNWRDDPDSSNVTITPITAHHEVSDSLKDITHSSQVGDLQPPETETPYDIYLVDDEGMGEEPTGAYRSIDSANEAAELWNTIDHMEGLTITGYTLHHTIPDAEKTEQEENDSEVLKRL